MTNGDIEDSTPEPNDLQETVKLLALHGFISRVRPEHFHSVADNRVKAENWVQTHKTFPGAKGKQLQLEIDEAVVDTLEEWYDGRIQQPQLLNGSLNSKKRVREEPEIARGRKRTKLQNGVHGAQDQVVEETDGESDPLEVSRGS